MEHGLDRARRVRGDIQVAAAALVIACVACAAGCMPAASASEAARDHAQPPAIPITAATVTRGDVGIYLSGLGSVVPLRTVTLRTRVDGEIMKVYFTEGQMVDEGQLLVQIDPRPFRVQLELAHGQLVRDRATLENAVLDLKRYEPLAGQQLVSQQQADTQRALVRQAAGAVESDQANVDSARLQLTYARITAPIRGRVGLRLVDPGNIVHATDPNGLVVLTQVQPISVVFAIAEDSMPPVLDKLRAGERLRVDAYDRELTRRIASGYLLTTDNLVDPATGTLRLRALFDNEDLKLFPNQFVNPRLLLDIERDRALVPAAALQRGVKETSVFVVKSDRRVTLRAVTTGPSQGNLIAIERGLVPGELVVVEGADRLREGSRVSLRPAPASAAAPPGAP
jgi:multidrug efflux system membrane fusion protein